VTENYYASGNHVGGISEPLLCMFEDQVFFNTGLTMIMFHGDPMIWRVPEIIDRVVEAFKNNYWISLRMHWLKLRP